MTILPVDLLLPRHSFERPKFILHADLWVCGHRVPAGFLTDAATTPRILWPLFPPVGKWTRSAILHDYLLTSRTRREADYEFLRALTECDGVNPAVARLMWAGVSLRTLLLKVSNLLPTITR